MAQPNPMNDDADDGRSRLDVAAIASVFAVNGLRIAFPEIPFLGLLTIPPLVAATWFLPTRLCVGLAVASGLVPMVDSIARHDANGYATLTSTITEGLWTIALVLACLHGHYWRQRYTESMATDELTGLGNRRAFLERLEQECSRSRRTGTPLTLLFIDCDDFKLINDTRGHIVGNSVLRAVADSLRTGTRTYDCVVRFAGDEFIVLCPRTDDRVAKCVAQRLMQLMRDRMIREDCTLTFSMGVATFEDFQLAPQEMIAAVDQTMYRTKRGSKNAVSFMCDHPSD